MPLWFITPEPGPVPDAWHKVQVCVVGRWLAGNVAKARLKVVVELWQLMQSSAVVTCVVGASCLRTGVTPEKLMPSLWQLMQLLVMPTWFIEAPKNEVNWLAA